MEAAAQQDANLTGLTADIVSAYLSHNTVRAEDIATLINTVHGALSGMGSSSSSSSVTRAEPPMSWKKAVRPDYIISFEDGKHYKSMRRHLTRRGMTPEQYREKWGLPRDFPMVAASYSARRSEMAKSIGLGQARKGKAGAKKGGGKRKAA